MAAAGVSSGWSNSALAQGSATPDAAAPVAQTSLGAIRGRGTNGVAVFRGVRYARPPVGERRFLPPEPLATWSGVQDALSDGLISLQPASVGILQPFESPQVSGEDSLTLSIWTRGLDSAKRPVLVWLHGGGLVSGAGSLPVYAGERLAREGDVVVVTVNYRLGALGYLRIPGVTPGNLGLRDQLAALEWVREHISAFGGDSGNVTVAGQSGGAYSIGLMLAGDPKGRGLFRRAIIQSPPTGAPPGSAEHAARAADIFLGEFGLTTSSAGLADRLRAASADQILQAQLATTRKFAQFGNTPAFLPTADGDLVPLGMAASRYSDVVRPEMDVIIGTGRDEAYTTATNRPELAQADDKAVAAAFARIFGDPSRAIAAYRRYRPGATNKQLILDVAGDAQYKWQVLRFAQQQAARGHRAYVYQFDWAPPSTNFGPGHYMEVPFVFGTTADVDRGSTVKLWQGSDAERMESLSRAMRSAWIAFVRTGRPEHPDTPPWPSYDAATRMTMTFNETTCASGDPAGFSWRSPWALS